MAQTIIPDTHKDLVEKPYYTIVTTVMPDDQPVLDLLKYGNFDVSDRLVTFRRSL